MTNQAFNLRKENDTLWPLYKALLEREAELCHQIKTKDIIIQEKTKRLQRAEHMGNIRAHERGIVMQVLAQLDPAKCRELDRRLRLVGAAH